MRASEGDIKDPQGAISSPTTLQQMPGLVQKTLKVVPAPLIEGHEESGDFVVDRFQTTSKYPPAEPGALGIEPLKAAGFGAAEAAPRWWLADLAVPSFLPLGRTSTRIASWTWDLGQDPRVCPPDASPYNAL